MKVHPFPIAYVLSVPELKQLAEEFLATELAKPVELKELGATAWFVFQLDGEVPIKVTGLGVMSVRIDVPLIRFLDVKSGKRLIERMMAFASDQGNIGSTAQVYISSKEAPEQRCAAQREWLQALGATPADRWEFTIK